jgi:DNA-directed RNA polymerase specialized sigma24 family protein
MSRGDPESLPNLPTTNWITVRNAGATDSRSRQVALEELLRRYWPALVAHLVCSKKLPRDRAEDLVQSFIQEKILERNLLGVADSSKGKFRTFLLTALDRFVIDCWRKEGSSPPLVELTTEPGSAPTADVFDVAWAMRVFSESVQGMRAECEAKERPDLWGVFEGRALVRLQGTEPLAYKQLANRLGLESARQASNRYGIAEAMFHRNFAKALAEFAGNAVEEAARDFRQIFSQAGAELIEELRIYLWNDVPEVTMSTAGDSPFDTGELSRLIELPRPPVDSATQLRQVLLAPLPLDLDAVDPELALKARTWAEQQQLVLKSFGDLLYHHHPLPELLELAKEFAKEHRADAESPLLREVATVLYYASIAAALTRCGRRITQHDDATLRKGFQWGCEQPWVDEATRALLRDGLQQVGGPEAP